MHDKRPALTVEDAYVLAAKLRREGITASARDVLTWSPYMVGAARLWLETVAPHAGRQSFEHFMGADLPPPSSHRSWPPRSAGGEPGRTGRGRGIDGSGS